MPGNANLCTGVLGSQSLGWWSSLALRPFSSPAHPLLSFARFFLSGLRKKHDRLSAFCLLLKRNYHENQIKELTGKTKFHLLKLDCAWFGGKIKCLKRLHFHWNWKYISNENMALSTESWVPDKLQLQNFCPIWFWITPGLFVLTQYWASVSFNVQVKSGPYSVSSFKPFSFQYVFIDF